MPRRSTRVRSQRPSKSESQSEAESPQPRRSGRKRAPVYQTQSEDEDESGNENEENESRNDNSNDENSEIESNSGDEESDDESGDESGSHMRPNFLLSDLHDKSKKAEAITRFKYLLGISDLLVRFVEMRAGKDPFTRQVLDIARQQKKQTRPRGGRQSKLSAEEPGEETASSQEIFTQSPHWLNGTLREYQIEGLNWLISLHHNCISGILADEMGLGKTLQTISFLSYLKFEKNIEGPHLILVPKSTVNNWAREIERFAPSFNVLVIGGDKYERAELINDRLLTGKFDICITSFELVIKEKTDLKKFQWQYLIVDEAHRIKNEDSMLSKIVRTLFSHNRLLITGTPLQNNLHELWALLNFIIPDVFSDSEVFDEWFQAKASDDEQEEDEDEQEQEQEQDESGDQEDQPEESSEHPRKEPSPAPDDENEVIEQLHKLLRPFLLRRVKSDVETSLLPKKEVNLYVGLTEMQLQWYRQLLERDIDTVNATSQKDAKTKKLLNVVMQLRKCCNHPYLFEGAEPGPPYSTGEHIVENAAKMIVLDKLLKKIHAQGSRVLIFSQMTHMLDILEDYCALRDYEYSRIDGSTIHEDRVAAIDEFNMPNSKKFLFLLTTRAGGLGINLTTADQVVIYDSDWNPQADLQAMDRAHRIGQTKQVHVYRFVTENAIEEKVLEKAARKLRLDQLVIQQARNGQTPNGVSKDKKDGSSKEELVDMIRHGAQSVFDQDRVFTDDVSIDDILSRGEARTSSFNDKYSGFGLDEIQKKFTFKFDHTSIVKPPEKPEEAEPEQPQYPQMRRARVEYGYHDKDRRAVKAPRLVPLHDFQFFPPELEEIQEKEMQYYRKQLGVKVTTEDMSDEDEESIEQINKDIANAQPLTAEEREHKEKLIAEGFPTLTKRDFHTFIHLMVTHGKYNLDEIVSDWQEKPEEELRRYHNVFLKRYKEIAEYQKYMAQVDAGETKAKNHIRHQELLKRKYDSCANPVSDLQIVYPLSNSKKSYTEDEDRFLLAKLHELGFDTPDIYEQLRDHVRTSGLFDFDWYFLSRTPVELGRRCSSLLGLLMREAEGSTSKRRPRKAEPDEESASKRAREETPL